MYCQHVKMNFGKTTNPINCLYKCDRKMQGKIAGCVNLTCNVKAVCVVDKTRNALYE